MKRCIICDEPINSTHKDKRYCPECAWRKNIDETIERYHKRKAGGWHVDPNKQPPGNYWELTDPPPEHEDLRGIHFTFVDFKYGDYSYLAGSVMMRAGKEYVFDGKRARIRE